MNFARTRASRSRRKRFAHYGFAYKYGMGVALIGEKRDEWGALSKIDATLAGTGLAPKAMTSHFRFTDAYISVWNESQEDCTREGAEIPFSADGTRPPPPGAAVSRIRYGLGFSPPRSLFSLGIISGPLAVDVVLSFRSVCRCGIPLR